jgi:tRNA-uridine 2-sulfurtransferase
MSKYTNLKGQRVDAVVKIRYNDADVPPVIEQDGDRIKVLLGKGVHAVTPGQAAVFYEGNDRIRRRMDCRVF